MTCRAATGFVFHVPSFLSPAPSGYAMCQRCLRLVTIQEWARDPCPGAPAERPIPPDAIGCAVCGVPIHVDPMHRATVDLFGTTCAACFEHVDERSSA